MLATITLLKGTVRAALEALRARLVPSPAPVAARVFAPAARRVIAPALAVAALAAAVPAEAREWIAPPHRSPFEHTADGRLVDVEILVEGDVAPLYLRPGRWDRRYVQAFEGREYALSLRNNTGRRVAVLVAVDGLNVVSGERSSLGAHEPMYVLGPWERTVIRGWRTSLRDIRRFVFVDESRSYAERTGQSNGDLGWIRVLSFRERERHVRIAPPWSGEDELGYDESPAPRDGRADADDAPAREGRTARRPQSSEKSHAMAPESNPGTGWGERGYDPVRRTRFEPAGAAVDHLVFRYEYASGLRALGIVPVRGRTWEREHGHVGFARPPRW